MGKRMSQAFLMALGLCFLCFYSACGETRCYVFPAEDAPQELDWLVEDLPKEEIIITLTFAGDCTLGGETQYREYARSFFSVVEEQGMAYPFQEMQTLFATDDFTLINLEGPLSDSEREKVDKKFNFLGNPDYTAILQEGSVECVNLANNHILDYGRQGYESTKTLLDAAGVGYVDQNNLCVLEKDGIRIGLTATSFGPGKKQMQTLEAQMELLRELGCQIVIHSMHIGVEYEEEVSSQQRNMAKNAIAFGASMVIGHHPHIVQGVEQIGNVPVCYSLGNHSFGGNFNPRDKTALLLRASFHFSKGIPTSLEWSLYPISISGQPNKNNFQPVLLSGEEAQKVIDRMQKTSNIELFPYTEGAGAVQAEIFYEEQEES